MDVVTFDLTGHRYSGFNLNDYCDVFVAGHIPQNMEAVFRLAVWGVRCTNSDLKRTGKSDTALYVHDESSPCLYLSGWGMLQFEGVRGGDLKFTPYKPSLDRKFELETHPKHLYRQWACEDSAFSVQYTLWGVLERPLGIIELTIHSSGPVTLCCDPGKFICEDEVIRSPDKYGFDFNRTRELEELIFALNQTSAK